MNPIPPPAKTSTRRHRRRRDGERSERSKNSKRSTSIKTKSNQSSSQHIRECACQRGLSCIGMTQAFRLLGDPRCYYVELPRYRKDPPAYKYVFRNSLRAAYIRHLAMQNPSLPDLPQILAQTHDRRYVALHHFHPRIVQAFYSNPLTKGAAQKHKVPISITEHELKELGMEVYPEDRILSLTGKPTGGYYFCPGYSQAQAHEDLKALIKKERGLRETSENERNAVTAVPVNIEIRSKAVEAAAAAAAGADAVETSTVPKVKEETVSTTIQTQEAEREQPAIYSPAIEVPTDDEDDDDGDIMVKESTTEDDFIQVISGAQDSEFDSLWADVGEGPKPSSSSRGVPSIVLEESAYDLAILEAEENAQSNIVIAASTDEIEVQRSLDEALSIPAITKTSSRDSSHPWHTPKFRRYKDGPDEMVKRVSASPAIFIDPTMNSPATTKTPEKDVQSDNSQLPEKSAVIDRIAAAQKSAAAISAAALEAMKSFDDADMPSVPKESAPELKQTDPPGWSAPVFTMDESAPTSPRSPPRIYRSKSQDSADSGPSAGILLQQRMPGFDPTLRIQVHNSLIAWESKRRTETSQRLEKYGKWWLELKSIVDYGTEEVDLAERFVSGFSKAGIVFADVTQAVCDDTLFDDGELNTVGSSLIPSRLQKKRNTPELTAEKKDPSSEFGHSTLLTSIISTQLDLAQNFRDCSSHIDEEIMPELEHLRRTISASVKEYERLGDGIMNELRRSEIELKNIWDVFDAMVTGDLMEYTAHGSQHSSHHGSQHGGTLHSYGSSPGRPSSFQGVGEGPIISSMQAPAIKSTFRQLGSVEDGWLVEMYYRSAVTYQQAVFRAAEEELTNVTRRIADLEEGRYGKLHEVLLSFVPRQRRLFNALPEQFKGVLEDLVGLRIDEDTLQTLIDEMIKERSYDHLKRGASHRSSIMNRSRLNTDNEETEVENIETRFGDPFRSPMVVLSKVVGLQIRGLVNATWKMALVVVTLEGNLVILPLPDDAKIGCDPMEAFRSLCPAQTFDTVGNWTRTNDIAKNLTPTMILSLVHSSFSIPNKMQPTQLQIVEEFRGTSNGAGAGAGTGRFLRAVRAAADSQFSKKCTLRLTSASETTEWMHVLERTKKVIAAREHSNNNKTNTPKKRFAF